MSVERILRAKQWFGILEPPPGRYRSGRVVSTQADPKPRRASRDHSYTSGIEFIADELYADSSIDEMRVTLRLPGSTASSAPPEEVEAAVARYCAGRLKYLDNDVRATRWRGVRAVVAAAVALIAFIGLSNLVNEPGNTWREILATGLAIAGWVLCGSPSSCFSSKSGSIDSTDARIAVCSI